MTPASEERALPATNEPVDKNRSEQVADSRLERGSRFTPGEAEMRAQVIAANDRAERLARRILTAERAIKQNQPSSLVLSILEGHNDA